MKILSIETSCDETGISILETKKTGKNVVFKVLANSLNSQIDIHKEYGGVFPALAKREHQKNLPILFERTLKKSKTKIENIDLIAVTSGPGLEPALWTGIVFAKEISAKYKIPILPVNHMEGHILSVFAEDKKTFSIPKIKFPVLSLLVSGGHTELVLMKDWMKYQIIGETLDDAAGEAFDKVARMIGLPYPGGPEISKLAEKLRKSKSLPTNQIPKFILPRPMIYSKNFDFSFSGLKTAVLYLVRDLMIENPKILQDEKIKQAICLEFENAVIETLIHKTKKAIEKYNIKTIIVAGGVSSNKYLRKEMQKLTKNKQDLFFPSKNLSTDNSIMIGIAGYFKFLENNKKTIKLSKIRADGGLRL
ncbi:MAG TPA: tRNA (adenosine(37)-N6)-threonylcarbamoyltransferase complex transferase subunit TsaD [Candidatus Paceibacterota bacterium]|nr:tRNA (adenosine(37)-N6)-threonylcarbamoyltransferase complex transferase subunit TsaD [Candidatus Paceibacterota bacterium]HPT17851.1 tRNA (adenosine(37)-N6)-threonylcarbamoyltransferase complex transferase subunit TsaD [Candidatus Paceibacterota bacterium]